MPQEREYPTLLEKLADDLAEEDPGCPVLVAVTGDMAQIGAYDEIKKAEDFIRGLTTVPLMGRTRSLDDIFVVPGNHDVLYDTSDIGERWQRSTEFHNRLRSSSVARERPWDLDAVDDRIDDLGAVIVTVTSAIDVEKGKPDESRGRVDSKQIDVIQDKLEAIDGDRLESAIRVALIYHQSRTDPCAS